VKAETAMMKDASQEALSPRAERAREATRRYLQHLESELQRVQSALGALSGERARDTAAYVSIEEESTKLANLYVSCARLDGAADRAEVLVAIEEIVINVIGSEELALFEVQRGGAARETLAVRTSFGLAGARLAAIADGRGAVHRAARGAAWWIGGVSGDADVVSRDEEGLTACVPIVAEEAEAGEAAGDVRFVLAIFHLLPHKSELDAGDRELLHVLSRHAAHALQRTSATP
jgi:hypothetical protein